MRNRQVTNGLDAKGLGGGWLLGSGLPRVGLRSIHSRLENPTMKTYLLLETSGFQAMGCWSDCWSVCIYMAAAQNVRSGSSPVPTHDPDLRSRPPIQTFRKDLIQTFDPDLWNDIMYW